MGPLLLPLADWECGILAVSAGVVGRDCRESISIRAESASERLDRMVLLTFSWAGAGGCDDEG